MATVMLPCDSVPPAGPIHAPATRSGTERPRTASWISQTSTFVTAESPSTSAAGSNARSPSAIFRARTRSAALTAPSPFTSPDNEAQALHPQNNSITTSRFLRMQILRLRSASCHLL